MMPKAIPTRHAQRGVAAILLALMVLVFTGTLAVSMFLQRGQGAQDQATREQSASLEHARHLLVGFVMREGRLPCAAQAPHGEEDCAAPDPKGWLPTGTLDPMAAAAHTLGRLPVRYMVYRAAGADLTSAGTNEYIPSDAGGVPLAGDPVVYSTLDTCRKLYLMASPAPAEGAASPLPLPVSAAAITDTPSRWSMAYGWKGTAADTRQPYVKVGTEVVNVAFGLAVSPAGASAASSGVNAVAASAQMAVPGSTPAADYRDQVLIEEAGALSRTLGCGAVQASVDLMATAAAALKQANIDTYGALLGIQSVVVLSSMSSEVESSIELADANVLVAAIEAKKAVEDVAVGLGEADFEEAAQLAHEISRMASVALGFAIASTVSETASMTIHAGVLGDVSSSYVWQDVQPLIMAADRWGLKP